MLERHFITSVRRHHPESAAVKQMIQAAVQAYQKTLNAGGSAPEAPEELQRVLSAGPTSTTAALARQTFKNKHQLR